MTTQIEVRERPILFSGPMIRAILDGRKTQTRRVIKPQPDYLWHDDPCSNDKGYISCPYGKPGDRLWCRETWQALTRAHGFEWENLYGDMTPEVIEQDWLLYYRATDSSVLPDYSHWRPSIHMPRWASRITLEVTGVRVERLQAISEDDAIAEGIYPNEEAIKELGLPAGTKLTGSCVDKYRIVWESINGKKHPWSSNPWVWCVSFRRVEAQ